MVECECKTEIFILTKKQHTFDGHDKIFFFLIKLILQ